MKLNIEDSVQGNSRKIQACCIMTNKGTHSIGHWGYMHIIFEFDSILAINLITNQKDPSMDLSTLVHDYTEIILL